jgi:pimeloyl-ACP methyl ester carboxylesterase
LISFDQRGTGVSDPVPPDAVLALEQWLDDIVAVMDEARSEQAVLLGLGGGGSLSMLFAATYPERTAALVLVNSFPRLSHAPDYEWGRASALEDEVLHVMRTGWGRGVLLDVVAPSKVGDEAFRQWWARYQRLGSSPGTIVRIRRMLDELDVRDVLPSIRVPTLVLHRADNTFVRAEHGRYLGEHIPEARHVEVPGSDYFVFLGNVDVSWTRSNGSSRASHGRARPTASSQLCCLRTSSDRLSGYLRSVTAGGLSFSARTTMSSVANSGVFVATKSIPPGMVSSPPSTDRRARLAAR